MRARFAFLAVVIGMVSFAEAERLLVLSKAQGHLAIIDPATLKVEKTVPVGRSPHEVCASADGKLAFVANYGSTVPGNSISVIDIESGKELKRVDLGSLHRPHGLAEYAGKIYFTAEQNAVVARLDPVSSKVDLVLGTGQLGTHMIAIDQKDGRLFTANIFSGSVSILGPATGPGGGLMIDQVPVTGEPEGIALSPDGIELWVGQRTGGSIHILDTLSSKLHKTLPFDGVPIRLSFTPDGTKVIVSDAHSNALVVLDARTQTELFRVETKKTPVGHVVSPDGKTCYVSCGTDHVVQVIDLEAKKVTGEIDAGSVPDGIALASARPVVAERRPGSLGVALLKDEHGVVIDRVMPDSAAAKVGLQAGDRILRIDGSEIADTQAFIRRLNRHGAGEDVAVVIDRAGSTLELTITLGERPG